MDSVKVTYDLPADLVAEIKALGLDVEQAEVTIEAWRERIRRVKAKDEMRAIMKDLQSSPDNEKPTPEEIQAEIKAFQLVERAKALGIDVENRPDLLIEGLEKAIQKYEAVKSLDEIRAKLDALPTEMQLTKEEIDAELRDYYQEKAAQKQNT